MIPNEKNDWVKKCAQCATPKKQELTDFIFDNKELFFCTAKCYEQNWKLFKKIIKRNRKFK